MAAPEDLDVPKVTPAQARSERIKKLVAGAFLVILIAVSQCGTVQFAKKTYRPDFKAPFFVTWFSAISLTICYPVYLLVMLLNCGRKESFREIWRRSQSVYGPDGLTLKKFFTHAGIFSVIGLATNYSYIRALDDGLPSVVTALFASNPIFVFSLSCIFLGARAISLKIISVILAVTGVVLITYSDKFSDTNVKITGLAVTAAFGAASYTVLFKRVVGNARPDQVSLFLSVVATFTALSCWPVILILNYTGVEILQTENIPWLVMLGSCSLSVVFNFLLNFGVAYTYPLFIAFGGIVGVPLNYLADYWLGNDDFNQLKIIGTTLVLLSFVFIVLLPIKLDDRFYSLVTRRGRNAQNGDSQSPEEMEELKRDHLQSKA